MLPINNVLCLTITSTLIKISVSDMTKRLSKNSFSLKFYREHIFIIIKKYFTSKLYR